MKKSTIKNRIISFVLLFAMVMGMTTTLSKKADATGGWKVTLKYYNGEVFKTYYNCPTNSTLKLPAPAKSFSGATFVGWKSGSSVYSTGTIITIKSNMELVGVWSFYASFTYNGTMLARLQQKTGYKYNLPSNPTKSGYVFVNWTDSNGCAISSSTIVTDISRNSFKANFRITPDKACQVIDGVLKGAYDPAGIMKDTNVNYRIAPSKNDSNYGYVRQCDRPGKDENGNEIHVGLCPYCAFTNLLNRRSVLDRGKCAFLFEDHILTKMYPAADKSDGTFGRSKNGNYYRYLTAGKTKNGSQLNENEESQITFTGNGVSYTLVMTKTNGISRSTLKSLIDQHPEGVVIYSGGHAAVVTAYTNSVFYCIDTGSHTGERYSSKGQTLDAVFISDKYGSKKEANVLANTIRYWYVK